MGYSVSSAIVRGDLFTERGKWKYSVAIDMTNFYGTLLIHDAVRKAIRATPAEVRGVLDSAVSEGSGYWLVVLEPYHRNSYPVMIKL